MRLIAISLLLFASYATADQAELCAGEIESLSWLDHADPVADAKSAIKSGNLKFRAIHGLALIIPGIEGAELKAAYKSRNYVAIEGTSDGVCSGEHERLNGVAWEYARLYNQTLIGLR